MSIEPKRSRGYIYKETVEMDDCFLHLPRNVPVLIEVEVIPLTPEDEREWEDLTPEEKAELIREMDEIRGYPLVLRDFD